MNFFFAWYQVTLTLLVINIRINKGLIYDSFNYHSFQIKAAEKVRDHVKMLIKRVLKDKIKQNYEQNMYINPLNSLTKYFSICPPLGAITL